MADIRPGDRVRFTLDSLTDQHTGTVAEIYDCPSPSDPTRWIATAIIDDDRGGRLGTSLFNVEKVEG